VITQEDLLKLKSEGECFQTTHVMLNLFSHTKIEKLQ